MGTYTSPLGLYMPTPKDPAVANTWGTILNTNFALLAASIAGLLTKSVAGNANVVLSVANGSTDEARYRIFDFTGALTGNIYVLWPASTSGFFMVKNSTSGAFTLSLGNNNGSSAPAGTTATVPQGYAGVYYSDGTNVGVAVSPQGLGALAAANNLSDVDSVASALSNLGIGSMALRALTIQNGGSPSGGADGDVYMIY